MIKIKQGYLFPPTAKGTGYLALFICGLFYFYFGEQIFLFFPLYLLVLYFLILQFTTKSIVFDLSSDKFEVHYNFLGLKVRKKRSFSEFRHIVLKKINESYRVRQGMGIGMSFQSGVHKESYYAIVGYSIKNKENETLIKGQKEELIELLKKLPKFEIKVYLGAPKANYELNL